MQVDFLRKNNTDKLIIFILGWGADSSVLDHLSSQIPEYYDIVCTYDYKTIENIDHICTPYSNIYLIAWSFGVWAAEKIFSNNITFTKALAFCASPHPVSSEYGIEPKRLKITIKGFKTSGTLIFDKAVYQDKIPYNIKRELDEKIEELEILERESTKPFSPTINWDTAIIGEKDTIFPAKNLLAYWGFKAKVLPLPHFPFKDYKLIAHYLDI